MRTMPCRFCKIAATVVMTRPLAVLSWVESDKAKTIVSRSGDNEYKDGLCKDTSKYDPKDQFSVYCVICNATGPVETTPSKAIHRWNNAHK